MALTDTREYWDDVKKKRRFKGPDYYHIPGLDCGHYHYFKASCLAEVNCSGCIWELENGYIHGLPYVSKSFERKQKKQKKKNTDLNFKSAKKELFRNSDKYGKCSCGYPFVLRTNRMTHECFLGCSAYPRCKKTKNIKSVF
jgi:hypothetical protein